MCGIGGYFMRPGANMTVGALDRMEAALAQGTAELEAARKELRAMQSQLLSLRRHHLHPLRLLPRLLHRSLASTLAGVAAAASSMGGSLVIS